VFLSVVALAAVRVLFSREAKSLDLERERADRLQESSVSSTPPSKTGSSLPWSALNRPSSGRSS